MAPINKVIFVFFLSAFVGASFLWHMPVFAANPAQELKVSDKSTTEEINRKKITILLAQIRNLYKEPEPDLAQIARLYQTIFFISPREQQGKMALWESFFIYRKIKDVTSALGTLRILYESYRHEDVMDNPMSEHHLLSIRATADIEQASLYVDLLDSPLVAVDQMRNVPLRHPGAVVGVMDGERSYYGKVEMIVRLKTAEAYEKAEQYNSALMYLRAILENDRQEKIGLEGELQDIEWVAMRHLRPILMKMPASYNKKLVELDEMAKLSHSDLALAETHFIRAQVYEAKAREMNNEGDFLQAEEEYKKVINDYPTLTYRTREGIFALGPLAVMRLSELYTKVSQRPQRALQVLEAVENLQSGYEKGIASAAYARFLQAEIYYRTLRNPKQSLILLDGFGARYQSVQVNPSNEKSPVMLFEVAKKLEKEIRTTIQQKESEALLPRP